MTQVDSVSSAAAATRDMAQKLEFQVMHLREITDQGNWPEVMRYIELVRGTLRKMESASLAVLEG